jgi:hypothetical protein
MKDMIRVHTEGVGFFLQFCEVGGQVILHKRTYLAKFGYWLKKKQISF